jgi:hypothetical protein
MSSTNAESFIEIGGTRRIGWRFHADSPIYEVFRIGSSRPPHQTIERELERKWNNAYLADENIQPSILSTQQKIFIEFA